MIDGTSEVNFDVENLFDDAPLTEAEFNINDNEINYDEFETDTNHDLKSQKKTMNDVIIMLGEFNNFVTSFCEKSGYKCELYTDNILFNFDNKSIRIDMTFKSEQFDTKEFLNNFTDAYDKSFDDHEFEFILSE